MKTLKQWCKRFTRFMMRHNGATNWDITCILLVWLSSPFGLAGVLGALLVWVLGYIVFNR